jgi:hypothetical protein
MRRGRSSGGLVSRVWGSNKQLDYWGISGNIRLSKRVAESLSLEELEAFVASFRLDD